MGYEHLTLERHGHVALATLCRPDKLNALNRELQEETRAVCAEVEEDDAVRALVVTGSGAASALARSVLTDQSGATYG